MPTFTVLRRQDAFVDYLTEVEADTPAQAARIAQKLCADLVWEHRSMAEFDANLFVTLDEDGAEIEESACGKLA